MILTELKQILIMHGLLLVLIVCFKSVKGFNTTDADTVNKTQHITCDPVNKKPSYCACKASTTNLVVDLSTLDEEYTDKKPRFVAKGKPEGNTYGWFIAWSPCNDFDMFTDVPLRPGDKSCKNTGFALFTNESAKQCTSFGAHAGSAKFKVYGTDENTRIKLRMVFSHHDKASGKTNKALIWMKCSEEDLEPILTFDSWKEDTVFATFWSTCCCEGQCQKKPSGPNKWAIIGGSISGVVVMVGIVVTVYCKRKRDIHQPPRQQPVEHQPRPQPVEHQQEQGERQPLIR